MDINLMGEMDGIETAGHVRKKYKIPVVYLTGIIDNEIFDRAKLTDPYGYIIKQFELIELKAAIEIALYKHANQLKKEKRISDLQESVAELLWDYTSKNIPQPVKGGWMA